jgi:putative sugar O-methyltransferase
MNEQKDSISLKSFLRKTANSLLKRYDVQIVKDYLLYEWQVNPIYNASYKESVIPDDSLEYLVPSNPRLKELQSRYSTFNKEVTVPSLWTEDYVSPNDILYFRGDNAYVYQQRQGCKELNMNILSYGLTTYYVKSRDKLGLLEKLREDDLFGIYTFSIDDKLVSRDLLDSINEIYFLEKHLNISASKDVTILDIGAGYGRLAHRMLNALPNIAQYICTDAFPVSSFISDYYLRFRNLESRAKAVPLDEIERVLQNTPVDIAINIHSFPECTLSAIEWWISILAKYRIKNFMIVPNMLLPNTHELLTMDGIYFGNIIEKYGYELIAREPKYGDSFVQSYGVNPSYYYLFELRNAKSA